MASNPPRLILASGSPRRRELLRRFGFPFEVVESGVSEDVPAGIDPSRMVLQLCVLKARAVAAKLDHSGQEALVLGADTTIDLDGEVLGKPENPEEARRMLSTLRNRPHRVITGVALVLLPSARILSREVSTTVWMKDYSSRQLDEYVSSGEPMGKAGSYAIQGLGGDLVERISGCWNNVVGLPLCEAARMAEELLGRPLLEKTACRRPSGRLCPRLAHE